MRFLNQIKVLKKNSEIRKELDNIVGNLPSSDSMTKDILNMLGNEKTKCIFDEDIKGNYYVYLNDTIYLSNKQSDRNNYERLCVISHECIHSIQPKWIQKFNFIFSNLEMILFIVVLFLYFFNVLNIYLYSAYVGIVVLSIIPRAILEFWAIKKAPQISKEYLKKQSLEEKYVEKVNKTYTYVSKMLIPLQVLQLLFIKSLKVFLISLLLFYNF